MGFENQMRFDDLPLHDTLLAAICVSWEAARCELRVRPVDRLSHYLVFEGFSFIELPRRESWGSSSSINTAREMQGGMFEIELQSGDTIHIEARHWYFRPEHM